MTATTATAAPAAPRRGRKVLVPLATLIAATGIALASGATFSTSTASTGLVASGTLNQTNSNSVAFQRANLKPGDVVTGTVVIKNSGSLPALLTVTEAKGETTLDTKWLNLKVDELAGTAATNRYDGPLGSAGAFLANSLMTVGQERTFRYTVTFSADAPNDQQAKAARTTYTFATVQTAAETFEGTQAGTAVDTKPADQGTPLAQP